MAYDAQKASPLNAILIMVAVIAIGIAVLSRLARSAVPPLPSHVAGMAAPTAKPADSGYWTYHFPELGMELTLPCVLEDVSNDVPEDTKSRALRYRAYHGGWAGSRFSLAAFWQNLPIDPVSQANRDLKIKKSLRPGLSGTVTPTSLLGKPACELVAEYVESGRACESDAMYIQCDKGMYCVRVIYWKDRYKTSHDRWQEILASIRFDRKSSATIVQSTPSPAWLFAGKGGGA